MEIYGYSPHHTMTSSSKLHHLVYELLTLNDAVRFAYYDYFVTSRLSFGVELSI